MPEKDRSAAAARQLHRAALFGAAPVLRCEQLLAAGRRQDGRLLGNQAELATKPDRELAPLGRRPRGRVVELCMSRHMRILAVLTVDNGTVAASGLLPRTLNVHRTMLAARNPQATAVAMSPPGAP